MAAYDVKLLHNGQTLPTLGLGTSSGTWDGHAGKVHGAVVEGIRCGYRHIDTSEIYNTESEIGAALRDSIEEGTVKRQDVFIVSKVYRCHMDPAAVVQACRDSLTRLRLDYIDVYLIHNPMSISKSLEYENVPEDVYERGLFGNTDFIDTWKAMESLVRDGLVKGIGVSNFNVKQIQRLLDHGLTKPLCNQVEVTPYCPNTELLKYCKEQDIVVVAHSPLGGSTLLGRHEGDKVVQEDPIVTKIAEDNQTTPAQVLLRWAIQRGCAVIPKSYSAARIRANTQVFDFTLSDDDMLAINAIKYRSRLYAFSESVKHPHYPFHED